MTTVQLLALGAGLALLSPCCTTTADESVAPVGSSVPSRAVSTADSPAPSVDSSPSVSTLPAWDAAHRRARPLIAVVGDNAYTELTDYVVPYGVLTASGVADVVALGTEPGPIRMFPALRIEPQATVADFEAAHPEGADYVIVPAVHRVDAPALLDFVRAQAAKGATIVGVCDGAQVLARAGLLEGRSATVHWYSFSKLEDDYPGTRWTRDTRYVADGNVVTTTGVTASIPVSLALVESIAGEARARALADELGVADWGPAHESDAFRLRAGNVWTAAKNWLARWSHDEIGVGVEPGVDELALALQMDALSRTYRSRAHAIAADGQPLETRRGLVLIPDRSEAEAGGLDRRVPVRGDPRPALALDETLGDIEQWYGRSTADFVALQLEYPR